MDFKLYTNALKAYTSDNGDLHVRGTTSSTIRDLHGDEMTIGALKSMEETAKQNMTVFLNHNYNVPDDLFGSVTDARIVKRYDAELGAEVYDLDIDVRVVGEDENPLAMKTYRAIKRGVKLGLSIGAKVDKVSKKKGNGGEETYIIESVKLLETSVVGIPANQRSYLQSALKSLRLAEGASYRDDADVINFEKAVEVEGSPASERAALISSLQDLLADTTAFYLKAHGAHWNVIGEDFTQYHELFEEIYSDAQGAIDPTAELLRKLNAPALSDIREHAARAAGEPVADDNEPESLAEAVYAANEGVLECIKKALAEATAINEQGVLNFLAERQDMHQKWSWQLRASLAPEETEPEPAETPEVPGDMPEVAEPVEAMKSAEADKETSIVEDLEQKKTRVTVTVSTEGDVTAPVAAPAAVEPEVEEEAVDSVEKAFEPTPAPTPAPAPAPAPEPEPAPKPADEPKAPVADENKSPRFKSGVSDQVLDGINGILTDLSEEDRTAVLAGLGVQKDGEPEAEAPISESDAVVEIAEDVVADVAAEVAVEAPEVVAEAEAAEDVTASLEEVAAIAKSALDAAIAAQQEVASFKKELTELSEHKAKVEGELAKALDLVGRLINVPMGRKQAVTNTEKSTNGEKAPWLDPFIARLLDAQE